MFVVALLEVPICLISFLLPSWHAPWQDVHPSYVSWPEKHDMHHCTVRM